MINIGIIGMGMMGSTHLDAYAKRTDVRIVAVSDAHPDRLSGKESISSNIAGPTQGGIDLSKARRYAEGMDLIADPEVQLVDICLPTPMHLDYAVAALEAGKHLLVEKPLARTHADAVALAEAAAKSSGMSMCAMCMRFWPGWVWLKKAVEDKTYGKVLAAHFRRVTHHPGGAFYLDGDACGGAILDLHIHDTDFVQYCFGTPKAVFSRGYTKHTSQIDHVVTQYLYDDGPTLSAEGGWAMAEGFGFQMQYTVNFEHATAEFSFDGKDQLRLIESGKEPRMVDAGDGMGYEHEIAYFLDCLNKNESPRTVTLSEAAESVRIVEAEVKSIATGLIVSL